MEERIPFDIKYRREIEVGKYLVVTRGGKPARIVCWGKQGRYPIIALSKEREEDTEEVMRDFCIDGRHYDDQKSRHDLFLVPNPDHKEPTTTCSTSVDWDAFRREAAKDFASAILSNSALVHDQSWEHRININVIGSGVAYADELIKQLKEGKK